VSATWFARSLVAGALVLVLPAAARAQSGRVSGSVVDAQTGQPLDGVSVYLAGTGRGAMTRSNGRYVIINVPPGTYTVAARRLGYQESQVRNVSVMIDVTREVDFRLAASSATLATVRIEEARQPLVTPGLTGTADAISTEQLGALPVTDIKSALTLQSGFQAIDENTDVLSYAEGRRALSPVRVRGGRPAETITFVDGIPVNNFLFGGPALDFTTDAVQQIDFVRGGFESQYGNALSGIINIAVKEGTPDLRGKVEMQSTAVGGALGSRYDELRNGALVQGYLSGSIPGTADKLRYLVAGRTSGNASRVLKFDDKVYNPRADERDENQNFQSTHDLFPGYRAFGFSSVRDALAKVSYYFTPTAKLNLTGVDMAVQSQPYSFDWVQTGFDAFKQCTNLYPELVETCSSIYNSGRDIRTLRDLEGTDNENWYVRQSSTQQHRKLYVARYDQTAGRLAFSAAVGRFDQERNTCTYVSAICQGTRIAYTYINGPFVATGERSRNANVTLFGSEKLTGFDHIKTNVARADVQWQATDHHNFQGGVFTQLHDVEFLEARDVGLNRAVLDSSTFAAKPWDAAVYIQDRIEYDFLTLKIGARYDYGLAKGQFFRNPRDPTNGTTASDVCNNPTRFGLPADYFKTTIPEGEVRGLAACSNDAALMASARDTAALDDFGPAPKRRQFSPRVGVQFPLTERSAVFFNFGRYAQNPAMYDLYRGTGVGTYGTNSSGQRVALEGTPRAIRLVQQSGSARPLLGNPQLQTEVSTAYEIGYAVEFLRNYALRAVAYNKDQTGLTGIRPGGLRADESQVSDVAATYGAQQPEYNILVNTDYQVSRGLEMQLRRGLANFWSFELNYAFSRVTTNADPPEQEAQKRAEGDPPVVTRIRASIDQPHIFRGQLRFEARDRTPNLRWIGPYLRNTALTVTMRIENGLPYTPQNDFRGDLRSERNSGTSPTIYGVDMYGARDWLVGNVRLGAFVRVLNVFNRENCVQVFASTGHCYSGSFTVGRLENGRIGAGLSSTATFSQALDRADYRSAPRSINGGVRLSF
jgi:outer membrane receptor protein involved in Fe transport